MNKTLILIQCNDEVGLVTTITRIIAAHRLNITAMKEFADEAAGKFFTRIECTGNITNPGELHQELQNHLPENAIITIDPNPQKKIAILVTKEFHCLADMLVRHFFNTLGARICCVIGNYDQLKDFTQKFSIPFHSISHEDKTKSDFEKEILEVLKGYDPDYLVLAKFMRILSPQFINAYPYKIINIHHSFLPAFIGANPYRRAFERGVKLIGATAHFVTNELDEGPIIAQQTIPVDHTFGVAQMVEEGKEIEKAVLSKALQLLLQDRVFVTGNKTIVFE
jgi:formyltetrahydrofolate deformylase